MRLVENIPLDTEAVARLISDPADLHLVWPAAAFPFDHQQWRDVLDPEKGAVPFLVHDDGGLIGHAALRPTEERETYAVSYLYLLPRLRGAGRGGKLLELLEDYAAKRLGARKLILLVRSYNPAAIRCYTRAGFREYRREGTAIMMSKELDGRLNATFRHVNIIASDWEALARFYEEAFGCRRVPPERHLAGKWLDRGTGVPGADFSGVHLRLPGHGEQGPTLEIYQYARNEPRPPTAANREGISHLAFGVENVERAAARVLALGGTPVGEVSSAVIEGVGRLTFVYLADPEGNIIELQAWE